MVSLVPQFQVAAHNCGEVRAGTADSWLHHIHSQEQREMNFGQHMLTYLVDCICITQRPLVGDGAAHSGLDPPT